MNEKLSLTVPNEHPNIKFLIKGIYAEGRKKLSPQVQEYWLTRIGTLLEHAPAVEEVVYEHVVDHAACTLDEIKRQGACKVCYPWDHSVTDNRKAPGA